MLEHTTIYGDFDFDLSVGAALNHPDELATVTAEERMTKLTSNNRRYNEMHCLILLFCGQVGLLVFGYPPPVGPLPQLFS